MQVSCTLHLIHSLWKSGFVFVLLAVHDPFPLAKQSTLDATDDSEVNSTLLSSTQT